MKPGDDLRGTIIRARSLEIGYPQRGVLAGVDLDIGSGEFWCLLGANGAGKTSLVRVLLRLLAPTGGELWHHPELALDSIGFVPQESDWRRTVPTTVREFVTLGLVGLALSRAKRKQRLAEALASVDILSLELADYGFLSGGQRRRAVIARALIRNPRWLVLDEPTVGLDPATEDKLLAILARLNEEQGLTILLVTHDLGIARHFASHVILLHSNTAECGPAAALLTPANLERIYKLGVSSLEPKVRGGHHQ